MIALTIFNVYDCCVSVYSICCAWCDVKVLASNLYTDSMNTKSKEALAWQTQSQSKLIKLWTNNNLSWCFCKCTSYEKWWFFFSGNVNLRFKMICSSDLNTRAGNKWKHKYSIEWLNDRCDSIINASWIVIRSISYVYFLILYVTNDQSVSA